MNSEIKRCHWCGNDALYMAYHDNEWGKVVKDDQKMFEFLLLETFQAGLSWITILRKRENFREAFSNFDYKKIAQYDEADFERLMKNEGIIRNKLKINSAITNAKNYIKIQEEFGSFTNYIWGFTDFQTVDNKPKTPADVAPNNELSDKISKDLKKRGFKFVGTTVIYSHLQATGIINDHLEDCSFR